MISLYSHQEEALSRLKNGSILVGTVGSGKSRTALAYYILKEHDKDLYIITTAKKRDSKEWDNECDICKVLNYTIDSWNNIKKYKDVTNSFFIFDEDRVTGSGAWVKAFLKIAKRNRWIILSATPGDTWSDYIPVFIANGYFKNKTEFARDHIIYNRYAKFPMIDKYVNTGKLNKYRRDILVPMKDQRKTKKINIKCTVEYDKDKYKRIWRDRWDIYENCPIKETGKLFYLLRRVVNEDTTRIMKVEDIIKLHPKVIIFYNFSYELYALRFLMSLIEQPYSEWNGERHDDILKGDKWAYLVQYTAGAEGWNCIDTDTIIFYSQTYSYRSREQAAGRIDRMNTPFKELYYYHLISYAPIDLAIEKALNLKKNFNEQNFMSQNTV